MKKFILTHILIAFAFIPAAYAQQQVTQSSSTAGKATASKAEKRREVRFEIFVRTELFFGRNRANGPEITEEEFADFLAQTVTPEFPDGLTVLDGIGQFRDSSGEIIREKAKVLILLYPFNTRRESSRKIERIREAYKARFDQQSVLRADDSLPVHVSF